MESDAYTESINERLRCLEAQVLKQNEALTSLLERQQNIKTDVEAVTLALDQLMKIFQQTQGVVTLVKIVGAFGLFAFSALQGYSALVSLSSQKH